MDKYEKLSPDVLNAIHSNRKIEAIKLLRESNNLGLKEAKQVVDKYMRENPDLIVESGNAKGLGINGLILIIAAIVLLYFLNSRYNFFLIINILKSN